MPTKDDRYAQTLILLAADYATAEDKAFLAMERDDEAKAAGAQQALEQALAAYLGITQVEAAEIIAAESDQ